MCMKQSSIQLMLQEKIATKRAETETTNEATIGAVTQILLMTSSKYCVFLEYSVLRYERHDLSERCIICRRSVHKFYINDSSYIEINETQPFYCEKLCRAGFQDIPLDMTAGSKNIQYDENGTRFRIKMRKKKKREVKKRLVFELVEVENSLALQQSLYVINFCQSSYANKADWKSCRSRPPPDKGVQKKPGLWKIRRSESKISKYEWIQRTSG